MSDEYGAVETTDEAAVTAESTEGDASNARRGRPRDQGVIERDQRVLEALEPGGEGKTKSQLASELGLEANTVYLSLWRLHKDNQVTREQRVWKRV